MLLLILFLVLFYSVLPVKAEAPKFNTGLTVEYTYTASGSSSVRENFKVTNLTSQYLSSSYEYQISGEIPGNFSGSDSRGPLGIQVSKINTGQTDIRVAFNQVVPGKNRSYQFSLIHDGPEILQSVTTRKIIIPKFSNPDRLNAYTVILKIPKEYGFLMSSDPAPENSNPASASGILSYIYSDNHILSDGISAVFGKFRIYKYFLEYHPINNTASSGPFSLLLPKGDSDQRVLINRINPQPSDVVVDDNGNWIAVFMLKPHSSKIVNVSGQIQLSDKYLNPVFTSPGYAGLPSYFFPIKSEIFPDTYIEPQEQLSFVWNPPFQVLPFIKNNGSIVIKNIGMGEILVPPLILKSHGLTVDTGINHNLNILPFGHMEIPVEVSLKFTDILKSKYLSVTAGSSSVTYNIPYTLFYLMYGFITFILAFTFLGAAAFAFRTWGLHLQKRRR